MKTRRVIPTLLCLASASIGLTSCATNGDPTTGGLFWSESANQQRLNNMQQELDSVKAENARQMRKQRSLENQLP